MTRYDHPAQLVSAPSLFRDLLLDTGPTSSAHLIRSATAARGELQEKKQEQQQQQQPEPYYCQLEADFEVFAVDV